MEQADATRSKAGRKSREQIQKEMTESPEFRSAVTEAVATALSQLTAKAETAHAKSGNPMGDGDRSLMRELAMSLAELTTQGTGRVKVSPEVLQNREAARQRMINLIIEARAEKKVPTYHLVNKIFLNNRIIEPFWVHPATKSVQNTEIDFWGIPNDAMVPVNDTAKGIFAAYRDSLGTVHGVMGVANQLPNREELGVTAGGLVIRNSAVNDVARRRTPELPSAEGPMPSAYEEEDIHDYQPLTLKQDGLKGQFKDVNVLGTIQSPARQSV